MPYAEVFTVSEEDLTEGTMGICLDCGETRFGCEPDAENYECESCGKRRVFGMEQALIMGRITIGDEE